MLTLRKFHAAYSDRLPGDLRYLRRILAKLWASGAIGEDVMTRPEHRIASRILDPVRLLAIIEARPDRRFKINQQGS